MKSGDWTYSPGIGYILGTPSGVKTFDPEDRDEFLAELNQVRLTLKKPPRKPRGPRKPRCPKCSHFITSKCIPPLKGPCKLFEKGSVDYTKFTAH